MEPKWPNSTPPLRYESNPDGTLSILGSEATIVTPLNRVIDDRHAAIGGTLSGSDVLRPVPIGGGCRLGNRSQR
jgi:hypothetical protein